MTDEQKNALIDLADDMKGECNRVASEQEIPLSFIREMLEDFSWLREEVG